MSTFTHTQEHECNANIFPEFFMYAKFLLETLVQTIYESICSYPASQMRPAVSSHHKKLVNVNITVWTFSRKRYRPLQMSATCIRFVSGLDSNELAVLGMGDYWGTLWSTYCNTSCVVFFVPPPVSSQRVQLLKCCWASAACELAPSQDCLWFFQQRFKSALHVMFKVVLNIFHPRSPSPASAARARSPRPAVFVEFF